MTERRSLWQRLLGGGETPSLPVPAKGPPLHHRPHKRGRAPPRAAREQLGESFSSEEFKP